MDDGVRTEWEDFLSVMFDCEECKHPFHFGECPIRIWSSGDRDPCGCQGKVGRRSCNRHGNCDKVDWKWRKEHNGEEPPFNIHCHDEDCEDCFGK